LITIPITLSLTLIFLYVFGYTLNIMTIGAIAAAIGLIIDDAIIVVEQIHRTHEEHPTESSFTLVNKAIKYLFPAMVGSSLSTIVIFLPFVLMSGVAGSYFKVMTDTMIITLVSSFFVVWVILPVVYILLSKEKHSVKKDQKEIKRRDWVDYFIRRPLISGLFSTMLIVASIYILPKLASGFLPEMDEGSLVLDYVSPPGSSLEATNEMLLVIDKILHTIPEIKNFSRRTGTQLGFFITEPNDGDYLIQLNDKRNKTTAEIADEIRKKVEAVLPSLKIEFGQVIGDMLGDLMESAQPIEIKIFGENHEKLKSIADTVASIITEVKGTVDVFNGLVIAGPEIKFVPDAAKLSQYNLTPDNFYFQMQTKIEGTIVGNVLEKNQYVNIRMLEYKNAPTLNTLKNSSIFLNNGKLKPMYEFAGVNVSKGVAEIERENLKPMVAVKARLDNRDLGSTLKDIKQKISTRLSLPSGYEIVYGGAYAQQQKAFGELLIILISAVLLVFIIILFLFRNLTTALGIITTAVLGVSGSLIALYITGTPLNVGSYTGIIMIVGIIGENSIFTYLQYAEARKSNMSKDESLIYSISTRLRPKLMTALGAITALAPLALGMGTGAQMHQPLAIAIIGGMIIALPLLLIVLPTLMRIIETE
ncbi:MAG: efflux RND transporter permease subunit, partial [Ignavibacteriaceae bacterium]|nr:efflux RND transporter permease subunit [Ignavibacteriaceae bacterium]